MPQGTVAVSARNLGGGNQLVAFDDHKIGVPRKSQLGEMYPSRGDQFEDAARDRIKNAEMGREPKWWEDDDKHS